MKNLSEQQKIEIKEQLIKKVGQLCCPMCSKNDFAISDAFLVNKLQIDLTTLTYDAINTAIPTIGFVCTNCGFLSQHALGVLGVLPKNNEK